MPARADDGETKPDGSLIALLAENFLGVPYRLGGTGPEGFDCSGLVKYVHNLLGRDVPRTAQRQYQAAEPVSFTDLRIGDLLFFQLRGISHVGIYVGAGKFVHAASTGKAVEYAMLNSPYWARRLIGAGRFGDEDVTR